MSGVNNISGKSLGRRPGAGDARESIMEAARALFAVNGYDKTSLRQIAGRAGVDPALIMHYFGSKQQLFVEAMLPLFEGPKQLPNVLAGGIDTVGRRLATFFVTMTSEPAVQQLLLGLFRSASSEEQAAEMVRTFVGSAIVSTVESYLPGPNKRLQANIVGAQLIGVFIARYIVRIEPLASTGTDELIDYLAPRLQAHFN